MDIIGEFLRQLFRELTPLLDWLLKNWAFTIVLLIGMVYWAGKQRKLHRRHT